MRMKVLSEPLNERQKQVMSLRGLREHGGARRDVFGGWMGHFQARCREAGDAATDDE